MKYTIQLHSGQAGRIGLQFATPKRTTARPQRQHTTHGMYMRMCSDLSRWLLTDNNHRTPPCLYIHCRIVRTQWLQRKTAIKMLQLSYNSMSRPLQLLYHACGRHTANGSIIGVCVVDCVLVLLLGVSIYDKDTHMTNTTPLPYTQYCQDPGCKCIVHCTHHHGDQRVGCAPHQHPPVAHIHQHSSSRTSTRGWCCYYSKSSVLLYNKGCTYMMITRPHIATCHIAACTPHAHAHHLYTSVMSSPPPLFIHPPPPQNTQVSIEGISWVSPAGLAGITPLASVKNVSVGPGPAEGSSMHVEHAEVHVDPVQSLLQGKLALKVCGGGGVVCSGGGGWWVGVVRSECIL